MTILLVLVLPLALPSCGGKARGSSAGTSGDTGRAPSPAAAPPRQAAAGGREAAPSPAKAGTTQVQPKAPAQAPASGGQGAAVAMSPAAKAGLPAVATPSSAQAASPQGGLPAAAPAAKPQELVLPPFVVAERSYGILAPAGPILPGDLEIGPLEDARAEAGDRAGAYAAAQGFLDALLKGRVAEEAIEPDRVPLIASLASPLAKAPHAVAYRVGRFSFAGEADDRSALAPIRLAWPAAGDKPDGIAYRSGELGLRFSAGTWYVESIHVRDARGN